MQLDEFSKLMHHLEPKINQQTILKMFKNATTMNA